MYKRSSVKNLFSLQDKAVLITGGYGLLGRQFARVLAEAGARVAVGGRDYQKARSVAEPLGGLAVELDVSNRASVAAAVARICDEWGTVYGLINNASCTSPADSEGGSFVPLEEFSAEAWNRSMEVDVRGMLFCAQEAGPVMARSGSGAMVNISSIYGMGAPDPKIYRSIFSERGAPYVKSVSYCVAKSAVLNLTRYLAVYWASSGIRVNTLSLGGVYDGQDKAFVRAYSERTPLGRMAEPDEYNGSLLFLLSDASAYMTGSNLVVDGGWTAW